MTRSSGAASETRAGAGARAAYDWPSCACSGGEALIRSRCCIRSGVPAFSSRDCSRRSTRAALRPV
eukprot:scaffold10297_cov113-Isochrysis_galbana.AAC.10